MKLGYVMLMVAVGAMLVVAPFAMAAGKGGDKGKGHDMGLFGKVTVNDGTTVTIELMAKKDAPAGDKKTVTASGNVFFKGEKGAESEAKIGDAPVGTHVMVKLDADGKIATKVVIMPAHEKKK